MPRQYRITVVETRRLTMLVAADDLREAHGYVPSDDKEPIEEEGFEVEVVARHSDIEPR